MRQYQQLCEFYLKYIDIQIKKYVALASYGVGPDAKVNAYLVRVQVQELLQIMQRLLGLNELDLETAQEFGLSWAYHHAKFYIENERLRARAGWLVDDNEIHTAVDQRVMQQLGELAVIQNAGNFQTIELELTDFQKQFQHDSYVIANKIFELARLVIEDVNAELPGSLSNYSANTLRKHAQFPNGRYYQATVSLEMEILSDNCTDFLDQSTLTPTTQTLSKVDAKSYAAIDRREMQGLLQIHLQRFPDSELRNENAWYKVGKTPYSLIVSSILSSDACRSITYAGVGLFTVGIGMAVTYMQVADSNQPSP